MSDLPPCVIFEDEHLLVVNKPPGWNTHAPAPFAGEGIYDWLRAREERWGKLAIVHRLDKETSGVMVFTKTPEANRSLTEQFTRREVRKEYVLLTDAEPGWERKVVRSKLRRVGERYVSGDVGEEAETEFEFVGPWEGGEKAFVILARPKTGRTHQIRVHAAEIGAAIIGDPLYGADAHKATRSARSPRPGGSRERLCLHSQKLAFTHPTSGKIVTFSSDIWECSDPVWLSIRHAIIRSSVTNASRRIHGASDGFPDLYVDYFGAGALLAQSASGLSADQIAYINYWLRPNNRAVYHKRTTSHVRGKGTEELRPVHIGGPELNSPFEILENGVKFEISFAEGYSSGLFLDQRDNRRRVLKGDWKGKEVLNTFAYTCGFSVCAALAGARATSLDLSKKYLEWGKRNFALNGIDPAAHDFIYGDVFDWLKRFAKKGRLFDLVLLDPPTFSQAKESGVFQAEKDYGKLVALALKVLRPGGALFASSNAAKWEPEDFMRTVRGAIAGERRKIVSEKYFPQPPDFPISRETPAYLKTAWFKIE